MRRCRNAAGRRAPPHLIDHLDAAETCPRRLSNWPCWPAAATAAQRHPDDVALGRPDEWLGFGNEAGFVVDQPHARRGFDRSHRARRPSSENASAAKVTSRPATAIRALVEHGILERRGRARARSASSGAVFVQAAMAQKMASGMRPGHICCST